LINTFGPLASSSPSQEGTKQHLELAEYYALSIKTNIDIVKHVVNPSDQSQQLIIPRKINLKGDELYEENATNLFESH
jgi:hypothetical protein